MKRKLPIRLLSISTFILSQFFFTAKSQNPSIPFPSHTVYTAGTILPNHKKQFQLDLETGKFYDLWKGHYLKNTCAPNQYYVWFESHGGGANNKSITVSEGIGYGMMITAVMAGYDPKAKKYFDGLYNFYRAHRSVIDTNLMGWNQVAGCINAPDGGDDSASDGDLDIAFSLLLAYKQWDDKAYLEKAKIIINACLESDINPEKSTVLLGDFSKDATDKSFYVTRPSDFMMDHFRAFQDFTKNPKWANVIEACYLLIEKMQTDFSSTTGLLPDFIEDLKNYPHPGKRNLLECKYDGDFYYNACRTPWRISTDYLLYDEKRSLKAVEKMNRWIKLKTSNNPENIKNGYTLNGDALSKDGIDAAFLCCFGVSAMVNKEHQAWLNTIWDLSIKKQLVEEDYFGNTLKMLSLLMMSGNWWQPKN